MLPNLRNERIHLRFQDFKSVSNYNSALYEITAQLQLCGDMVTEESKLEKTFTEQNNELLVKNHESCPCGSALVPEVNETSYCRHGRDSSKRGSRGKKNKRGGRKNKNTSGDPYKKEHDTDAKQNEKKKAAKTEMNLAEASVSTKSPKLDVASYLVDLEDTKYETDFDQFANGLFSVN
ncbi:uncharacterized protein LOC113295922 [Papaver somniferum]|uniref:uncharacterized protein LOC113295922 n=1 Tax=Papaver somniferum TaxID=3469 RepID=UPI000E7008F1|nr:uncharacterized protein LOC113295922 [Papaver somniferum]